MLYLFEVCKSLLDVIRLRLQFQKSIKILSIVLLVSHLSKSHALFFELVHLSPTVEFVCCYLILNWETFCPMIFFFFFLHYLNAVLVDFLMTFKLFEIISSFCWILAFGVS